MSDRPTVIIAPPPTPNGDLHLGHLAGPYLAADVFARYLRSCDRPVLYATGTDDSQTYVVATARRQGREPAELAASCATAIERTLARAGIAVDGYAPYDEGYRAMTVRFVTDLFEAGRFRSVTAPMPYAPETGEFLMEGLICGDCPVCLSESRGGLCESCGHPNTFDQLLRPRSTVDSRQRLVRRPVSVLALPLENYRDRLVRYYAEHAPRWRPHVGQLVREILARPLPDFPITYPYHWGIPAPFPDTPGQVLNAWVEGMPASMYCTAVAAAGSGWPSTPTDELWRAEHDARVVYFLGFDNAYFWGVTHLALLMAHGGRYVLPDTIVCNEFYELENEKFSTSKGRVVWIGDLLHDMPRDLVRFYLALTCPEHQRTNFSRDALVKVTGDRLVQPWNRLANTLAAAVTRLEVHGQRLAVPVAAAERAADMAERFRLCYELDGYSLSRAADAIVTHVARLARDAAEVPCAVDLGGVYHELVMLLTAGAPILIDLADAVRAQTGQALTFAAAEPPVSTVDAFSVPLLATAP